jgi:hypothetical protein
VHQPQQKPTTQNKKNLFADSDDSDDGEALRKKREASKKFKNFG